MKGEYIALLKEKDQPMAVKQIDGIDFCGRCEKRIAEDYNFCPNCGQRQDTQNIEL